MYGKSKEQFFNEDFILWCKDHPGKLPKVTSPDPTEKRLGLWKIRHRKWDKLIEFSSQYDPINKSKEQFFNEDFIPWCNEHPGKLPSSCSPDPTEKRLGQWRTRNRRWDKLIEFSSQYDPINKSREQVFEGDFIPWCKEHGRLPSRYSSDPTEKRLGCWRNTNGKWDKLIEFLSQYDPLRKSREQVFTEDFIPWCKDHPGKLPSKYSSDPTEKRLARWRVHNRKWDRLTQFSLLVKYSETSDKAKELLEKMIAAH